LKLSHATAMWDPGGARIAVHVEGPRSDAGISCSSGVTVRSKRMQAADLLGGVANSFSAALAQSQSLVRDASERRPRVAASPRTVASSTQWPAVVSPRGTSGGATTPPAPGPAPSRPAPWGVAASSAATHSVVSGPGPVNGSGRPADPSLGRTVRSFASSWGPPTDRTKRHETVYPDAFADLAPAGEDPFVHLLLQLGGMQREDLYPAAHRSPSPEAAEDAAQGQAQAPAAPPPQRQAVPGDRGTPPSQPETAEAGPAAPAEASPSRVAPATEGACDPVPDAPATVPARAPTAVPGEVGGAMPAAPASWERTSIARPAAAETGGGAPGGRRMSPEPCPQAAAQGPHGAVTGAGLSAPSERAPGGGSSSIARPVVGRIGELVKAAKALESAGAGMHVSYLAAAPGGHVAVQRVAPSEAATPSRLRSACSASPPPRDASRRVEQVVEHPATPPAGGAQGDRATGTEVGPVVGAASGGPGSEGVYYEEFLATESVGGSEASEGEEEGWENQHELRDSANVGESVSREEASPSRPAVRGPSAGTLPGPSQDGGIIRRAAHRRAASAQRAQSAQVAGKPRRQEWGAPSRHQGTDRRTLAWAYSEAQRQRAPPKPKPKRPPRQPPTTGPPDSPPPWAQSESPPRSGAFPDPSTGWRPYDSATSLSPSRPPTAAPPAPGWRTPWGGPARGDGSPLRALRAEQSPGEDDRWRLGSAASLAVEGPESHTLSPARPRPRATPDPQGVSSKPKAAFSWSWQKAADKAAMMQESVVLYEPSR